MILLAALLCNYGRGFCLIDIGTEGNAANGEEIFEPDWHSFHEWIDHQDRSWTMYSILGH